MLDLVEKPSASERPIALGRCDGNVQDFSGFLIRHADEISQLNHFGFDRMLFSEFVQHFVHGE